MGLLLDTVSSTLRGKRPAPDEGTVAQMDLCNSFMELSFCLLSFWGRSRGIGGSQARGRIGAPAAGLRHGSWQHWILNPLSEAGE